MPATNITKLVIGAVMAAMPVMAQDNIQSKCQSYYAAKDALEYKMSQADPSLLAAEEKIAFGEYVSKERQVQVLNQRKAIMQAEANVGSKARAVLQATGSESYKSCATKGQPGSACWLAMGEVSKVCQRYK
jgi:hypothetical protein